MKFADFQRLKKFMARTMSDHDAEAMTALKMANMLLIKEGLTWERVLDRSVKVYEEVEESGETYTEAKSQGGVANPHRHGAPTAYTTLVEAFDKLNNSTFDRQDGTFKYTIQSIENQFKKNGTLSEKQTELVLKAADCVGEDGTYRWQR